MVEKKRNLLFDNVRVLLICLVVFGHAIEQIRFDDRLFLGIYNFIYFFHMPLFVFCSGAFAKCDKKRIVKKYLIPYVVFQTLYGIFDVYVMKTEEFHFLESYYVLWYILALAVWNFVMPLFKTGGDKRKQVFFLSGSVAAGLLAGYADWIGKAFSLSRILVFFPFFLAGYYIRQENLGSKLVEKGRIYKEKKWVRVVCLAVFLMIFAGIYVISPMINTWALFGYTSYAFQGYTVYFRLIQYVVAAICGILLFVIIPGEKAYGTMLARNLMVVYYSHVPIIKCVEKSGIIEELNSSVERFMYSIFVTVLIISVCTVIFMGLNRWKAYRQERKCR